MFPEIFVHLQQMFVEWELLQGVYSQKINKHKKYLVKSFYETERVIIKKAISTAMEEKNFISVFYLINLTLEANQFSSYTKNTEAFVLC
jgi:hypothetical protein